MISTLVQYQNITRDIDRSLTIVANDPVVERETEYYRENIGNVTSIDEFMSDTRLYNYAMKAMGLEDMTYAKAFMRKVLEEGVSASDSFANQLVDTRYQEFAEAFNFELYGETAMSRTTSVVDDVIARYERQTLEENEGASNEGVRLALYFARKAPEITSGLELIADEALAATTYTMLGLADSFGLADVDKQAAYIEEHIDIEKLSDPEYVDELLQRFSALYDMNNTTVQDTTTSLLFGSGSTQMVSIGEDLLTSLQGLKLGGS